MAVSKKKNTYNTNQVGDLIKLLHLNSKTLKTENEDLEKELQTAKEENRKLKSGEKLETVLDDRLNNIVNDVVGDIRNCISNRYLKQEYTNNKVKKIKDHP